jgi:hypothetical protein
MNKTYELKLQLTTEQISEILDCRLGQKLEHAEDNIENLLKFAECIKPSNLNDQFCQHFIAELAPVVNKLIGCETDSYDMTNFHHSMLREFSNCADKKNTA